MRVSVDVVRLCQVLSNLLINAAKFTGERGLISVTAAERDAQVRLEVSDEGAGIEADQLERIFESFTQTERAPGALASSGLGLGLSLVRTLVGLHGGSVVAESEGLGRGSRFVVDLRQAAGRDWLAGNCSEPQQSAPMRSKSAFTSTHGVH